MNIYEEYKKQLRAELAAIKPEEDEMDRRLTSKEKMEIISRTDEPTQDLAEEYGVSTKAINYHLRKAGIRKGRGNGRKAAKKKQIEIKKPKERDPRDLPGGSLRELPIGELTTIAEHKFQLWKESPATPKNVNEELNRIIKAGNHLAEAAHRVQSEYDGIHRLRLALAEWYKARAE